MNCHQQKFCISVKKLGHSIVSVEMQNAELELLSPIIHQLVAMLTIHICIYYLCSKEVFFEGKQLPT